jgi:hypothetical protein
MEGVRATIRPCWNPPSGARTAPPVAVTIQIDSSGVPSRAEIKDTARYNRDAVFRQAADAAYRAVMNPRCHPWPLSTGSSVHTLTLTFNSQDY